MDDAALIVPLILASAGNVVAPGMALPTFLRSVLLLFSALYHPFYRLDTPGVSRLFRCGLFALFQTVAGAAIHFYCATSHKEMFVRVVCCGNPKNDPATAKDDDGGLLTLWKILSGDMADDVFHEWARNLGRPSDSKQD